MIGTLLGVLAIFGGIPVLSGILAGNSASNKRYEQNKQRREAERQAFIRRVTNPELERELAAFVRNPANWDAVCEETREFQEWLLSKNYKPKDLFCRRNLNSPEREELEAPTGSAAERIMLARRGYLPKKVAENGSCMMIRFGDKYSACVTEWCVSYLKEHDYVPEPFVYKFKLVRNGRFCGYYYPPFYSEHVSNNGMPMDEHCGWLI